jgi:hypothetical protein
MLIVGADIAPKHSGFAALHSQSSISCQGVLNEGDMNDFSDVCGYVNVLVSTLLNLTESNEFVLVLEDYAFTRKASPNLNIGEITALLKASILAIPTCKYILRVNPGRLKFYVKPGKRSKKDAKADTREYIDARYDLELPTKPGFRYNADLRGDIYDAIILAEIGDIAEHEKAVTGHLPRIFDQDSPIRDPKYRLYPNAINCQVGKAKERVSVSLKG